MSKVRMKEINTPLRLFRVPYYKAEDGLYYKRLGENTASQSRLLEEKKG